MITFNTNTSFFGSSIEDREYDAYHAHNVGIELEFSVRNGALC